jgi:uncharacterized protein YbjT (DUF2867 family)
MRDKPVIAIAGAGGVLGSRIARALLSQGATVRGLVRPGSSEGVSKITGFGAQLAEADPSDVAAMTEVLANVDCVVSALNGLQDVIIGRQSVLLEAAVRAGVRRFIPSDFAADFTKTTLGLNRNFDLRREFMARIDAAPIQATSILNGAFLDMLGAEMPIIQPSIHRVLFWHDADQPLDFTTKDDVAAYTAMAALDPEAPRILRIAGTTVTAREIAATLSTISNSNYRPLWVGNLGMLGLMIRVAKKFAPESDDVFPPWQGMQYMRDQFSGNAQLMPLDNARYGGLKWTSLKDHLLTLDNI